MINKPIFCVFFLIISVNIWYNLVQCTLQGEEVGKWAQTIADELSTLKAVTKFEEIQQNYVRLNGTVGTKDPTSLLKEVKENILRMMDRKMDAIRCIQQLAEDQAETFEYDPDKEYKYYSSRWSQINGSEEVVLPKSLINNSHQYLPLTLNNDTHFYNLPVNTNHSSVYVTTNVYDKEHNVKEAIQWSQALDKVFRQNYKSDPALSWQYFGSSSGIMRHYPAMHWVEKDRRDVKKDVFDCRIRTWFIEAATCTKDVIILIDNSGSMDGMGKHIGKLIAYSILDTFSNNDYVNVLNYSDSKSNYTVPCFANQLIQATKENIRVFKDVIEELVPVGKTTLEPALIEAFELLNKYRDLRGCNNQNDTGNGIKQLCNQAIMILTDCVNGNYTDLIMKYNHLYNGSIIPVRIFTYLIGQELTNLEEIKWMSCANKGYFTQVATLEQVTASVLQYIYVIARPLVLQAEDHPVSWTHAYADITYDDKTDTTINEPYRLLTSAAIPCYDTKINKQNQSVTAELLGVAGTDVPIDEFRKLTRPYKIGVNAYAFIVSNNGYVLMHPALRPVYRGLEKENYNSIDLTEVEQHYDDIEPHEVSDTVKQMRAGLVNAEEGSLHNVILKYHYDDNRRVSKETYDYYYTALTNTPFSLALAFPNLYGNYSLDVGDQIARKKYSTDNVTSFFKGKWRVHPKWVYCRYHYLEGHEFKTPEDEIIHFIGKMYSEDFKWELQYEPLESENIDDVECGRKTLEDDDYYCDKELVQRLIFDAENTYDPFKEKWTFQSDQQRQVFDKYNVTLRFVATMSGLTRWDYIHEEFEKKSKEFGDLNPRAIDEKWYKSAVLQHQYNSDSFVYSVPFHYELSSLAETLVTGSYAIFVKNDDMEAPGSVVGFQFNQTKFKQSVKDISKKLSNQCSNCDSCATNLICYIIDSSGYIIVDIDNDNTGKFIGELEGDLMETMLNEKVFIKKTFYDYQALCERSNDTDSSGSFLQGPVYKISSTIKWIVLKILYSLTHISLYQLFEPVIILGEEMMTNDDNSSYLNETEQNITFEKENDTADQFYACENRIDLYVLQQSLFRKANFNEGFYTSEKRKFYMKPILHSNLMFLAADKFEPSRKPRYTTDPVRISKVPRYTYEEMNSTLLPCQKLYLNSLERRLLKGCYNNHPLERYIEACGKADSMKISYILLYVSILCIYIYSSIISE